MPPRSLIGREPAGWLVLTAVLHSYTRELPGVNQGERRKWRILADFGSRKVVSRFPHDRVRRV